MTSTAYQSTQPDRRDAFCMAHEADPRAPESCTVVPDFLAPSDAHAAEARRMKAFAGQRRFQAPVADDFARGMLAPGHTSETDSQSLRHANGVWAAVINGLTTWWRGHRPV